MGSSKRNPRLSRITSHLTTYSACSVTIQMDAFDWPAVSCSSSLVWCFNTDILSKAAFPLFDLLCYSTELSPFQWTDDALRPLLPLLFTLFSLPLLLSLSRSSRSSPHFAGDLLDFSWLMLDELPGEEPVSAPPSLLAFRSCTAVVAIKHEQVNFHPFSLLKINSTVRLPKLFTYENPKN